MSGEKPNDNPNKRGRMDNPDVQRLLTAGHGGPELDQIVNTLVPQAPDEAWTTDIEKAKELAGKLNPRCHLVKMDDGSYKMAEKEEFDVVPDIRGNSAPLITKYERPDAALLIVQAAFRKVLNR